MRGDYVFSFVQKVFKINPHNNNFKHTRCNHTHYYIAS